MGIRYSVDEHFFDEWSQEMAYVLGYWFADGSIEYSPTIRGKYIRVTSTDRSTIESVRVLLSSEHTIVKTDRGGNYKTIYFLRIGNAKLFSKLQEHGVTERKSLTMTLPQMPEKYIGHFVRGYFDGDGCAYIDRYKNGQVRRLTTVFTSGSKRFLAQLQEVLHQIAHMSKTNKIHSSKGGFSGAFQLRYSTPDSIRLFELMYSKKLPRNLYLDRKRVVFETFFKIKKT